MNTGDVIEEYQASEGDFTLPTNQISSLHVDTSGVLWVGTFGRGVVLTNLANNSHRLLQSESHKSKKSISKNNVRAIKQVNNGKVWLGIIDYGVDIFDPGSLQKRSFTMAEISAKQTDPSGIVSIDQTSDGIIWLASRAGNLYRYSDNVFSQFDLGEGVGKISFLKAKIDGGLLILGEQGGVERRPGGSLRKIEVVVDGLLNDKIKLHMAVESADGTVWLNGDRYLYKLAPGSGRAVKEGIDLCTGKDLKDGMLIGPVLDAGSNFFVIKGAQLLKRKKLAQSSMCYELISTDFMSQGNTIVDNAGDWWGYNHKVDAKSLKVKSYSAIDNVPLGKAWITSKEKTKNDVFLFGTPTGIVMIKPAAIADGLYESKVSITDVALDGVKRDYYRGEINVPSKTKRIVIGFLTDDVASIATGAYRYRLIGFNDQWSLANAKERWVTYTNMSPGVYEFEVQSMNRDKSWSQLGVNVVVNVEPKWFQTTLFKLMALATLFFLVYLVYRLRTWQLRSRQKELEILVDQKVDELRHSMGKLNEAKEELHHSEKMAVIGRLVKGVAHEMNTPLGVLKMVGSMLNDKLGAKSAADSESVDNLLQLMNSNVSRLTNLVSNFKQISPDEYASKNESFLVSRLVDECLSVSNSILEDCSYSIDGDNKLSLHSNRHCLNVIILELIDNAVRHAWDDSFTEDKNICISWRERNQFIELTIEDNGDSVPEDSFKTIFEPSSTADSAQGVGLGLHKVQILVNRHLSGDVCCSHSALGGCKFVLRLPNL